jgi:hypothetical protein
LFEGLGGDCAGGAGTGSVWRGGSCSNVPTDSAPSHLDTSSSYAGANSYTPYADPDPDTGRSPHRGAISYRRATFADPYPYQDATASHSHRRPSYPNPYPNPNSNSHTSSDPNRHAHPDADPKSQSNSRSPYIDNYRLRSRGRHAEPGRPVGLRRPKHFTAFVLERAARRHPGLGSDYG